MTLRYFVTYSYEHTSYVLHTAMTSISSTYVTINVNKKDRKNEIIIPKLCEAIRKEGLGSYQQLINFWKISQRK